MNREQFIQCIGQLPEKGITDSHGLKEVVQRFPYCQSGQLLYYLSLLRHNDLQQQSRLKLAAAYAGDRGMLRDLVRVVEHLHSKDEPEKGQEQDTEQIFNEVVEGMTPEHDKPEPGQQAPATAEENAEAQEAISPPATKPDEQKPSGSEGDAEQDMLSHPDAGQDPNHPVDQNSTEEGREQPEKKEQKAPVKQEKKERKKPPGTDKKAGKGGFKQSKTDLIDQFILNSPRISRNQSDFYNPADYAKKSEIDREDIVSETLARIYFNQGSFGKAIAIYKKLILKVPEKSGYFARQIEKIKEKQNLNT